MKVAVFSSSRNAERVLRNAGVLDQFNAWVDGRDMDKLGLKGKPSPAMLLEAARRLGVDASRAAVIEDAAAGVEAGARGGFARVIGVNRQRGEEEAAAQTSALCSHGADLVVRDLSEVALEARGLRLRSMQVLPDAWASREALQQHFAGHQLILFLDYDGTLTPIVEDRTQAVLDEDMHAALRALARRYRVAIISGRDLKDIRSRVQLEDIFYAGSHGFEIAGPGGLHDTLERGEAFLPELDQVESELSEGLSTIHGHDIERKRYAIAVHYRRVDDTDIPQLEETLDRVLAAHSDLRKGHGKRVFQIQPDIDWDKGRALRWILDQLELPEEAFPLYIGDDITDEDAFRALKSGGIGIVVRDGSSRFSAADYVLADTEAVRWLVEWLTIIKEQAV